MDYNKQIDQTIHWIRETVQKTGLSKVVIGVSGGVDSAVSVTLLSKALGAENVFAALFPYGDLHVSGVEDAKMLVESLQIPEENVSIIDIQKSVNIICDSIVGLRPASPKLQRGEPAQAENYSLSEAQRVEGLVVRKGNIMARVRMIYLFDLAKKHNALVCGTENKTEHVLGYYTRFGDEASDIEPIRNFYKTDIWEMAKTLGVPEQIITKAPTAGLWEGQTDEGEFGFSYADADQILAMHFDTGLSAEQIAEKGISVEIVEKVLERADKNSFKEKLPYVNK